MPQTDWSKFKDEIDYVSFDAGENKLFFYTTDENAYVSPGLYKEFRDIGLTRSPRRGCYFQVWDVARMDAALALTGEILDESTTPQERAGDRGLRFAGYSKNAETRSVDAYQRSNELVRCIPFGQPVQPPGHHSRAGHLRRLKRSRDAMDKSVREADKRDYWAERAKSAIAHSEHKYKPDVILRRLKKLEADKGKMLRNRVAGSDLDWYDRWIAHLTGQIEYWQTIYDAGAGVPADKFADEIEKGAWILCRWGWGQILRVTKRNGKVLSVTLETDTITGQAPWGNVVVKYDRIKDYNADGPKKEQS